MMVREAWPDTDPFIRYRPTRSISAAAFWKKFGVSRIILSRELSLDEVGEIRQECPDIEPKSRAGALCIAYSGRCLLSGYFNARDPNRGIAPTLPLEITKVKPAHGTPRADEPAPWLPEQRVWLLEERERPGELMPIEGRRARHLHHELQDRAIEHVTAAHRDRRRFAEDRRTHQIAVLRRACAELSPGIDDAVAPLPVRPKPCSAHSKVWHNRGYTDGFLPAPPRHGMQNYLRGH